MRHGEDHSRLGQSRPQPTVATPVQCAYDDAPLRPFHLRVAVATFGGVFSDGFGLGIIGLVLSMATAKLALTPLWLGLLGGASLAGLFIGALLTGPAADRWGRRPVFGINMLVLGALSVLQFWVESATQLLVLRLLIGLLLGSDYVVSKALLVELTPRSFRGRILSSLSVAWAAGYAVAYFMGYALSDAGSEAWRWMLLCSALPCLLVVPLRLSLPESPMWLVSQGRVADAEQVVLRRLGPDVAAPVAALQPRVQQARWSQLWAPRWRRNTLVACAFFTCQVIPYFAIGTFVARVMGALGLEGSLVGGVFYNVSLLLGAVLGLLIVDRMPRRVFLVGSFVVTAIAMGILTLTEHLAPGVSVGLFALFAGVLSAAASLVYVYLPELFPTELRASGIGLAIAMSRIGSAASTFLLPVLVAAYGVRTALGACVAALLVGALVCAIWAPETRNRRLSDERA